MQGRFDLDAVLRLLAERGINEIQLEAGATLAGAFLAAGLVDEVLLYVAPVLLGERARPLFDGLAIDAMAQKLENGDRRVPLHWPGRAAAAAAGAGRAVEPVAGATGT